VVGTPTSVELPARSVDLVFLCATYSRLESPDQIMKSIHGSLRSGGAVVVIDFRRIPGISSEWVLQHVRADQELFTREILSGGFRLVEERKMLKECSCLRFKKQRKRGGAA
jgi:predicted methyltransferase